RQTITNPDDPTASPFGWHDTNGAPGAEFTTTQGNNVHAYTDVDGNNSPDPGSSPSGGASLTFAPGLDLTMAPSTYRPAAVVNLFYWNNIIHDVMVQYGFDEAAGNFQETNYSGLGAGSDYVFAEAQNAGNCNANFATPADGSNPRMQMFTCDLGSPSTDSDHDNGVIVHEYGHGISNRLTGGAAATSCLSNAEQMGEGWSDWYGLMFTMDASHTRTTLRPIGNWLLSQPQSGGGIRSAPYQPAPGAPYTTNFGVNGATYGDTNSGLSQPHGVGFVWATILWEMTWDLIDAHGFDADLYDANGTAGNQIAMNLVTEGLKLQPCSPGFVDGRDAILAADAALYPDAANPGQGLHYTTLWGAFARRGLGFSASQGSTNSRSDQTEAFDAPLPPPSLSYSPGSVSVTLNTGDMASETVSLQNLAAPGSQDLTWNSSILNADPTLAPTAPAPSGALRVTGATEKKGEDGPSGTGSASLTGGPDTFGYTFIDSNEPSGPAFSWVDISGTGTSVSLGDDAGSSAITLPFAFPFYGVSKSQVYIASNGFLTFANAGMTGSASWGNASIPSASAPSDMIAMLWDDLNPSIAGTVHYQDMGDGRFIVQFTGVPHYNSASEPNTFQAILYDDGTIDLQYLSLVDDASNPNSHTVGVENAGGTDGLQVVFNSAYTADNLAVRISPPATWVVASPSAGTVAPGAGGTFDVDFDATGVPDGTYTADLVLTTNDPANASVTIPLTMIVGGTPPGTGTVNGNPGWYLMGSPTDNTTIDQLASMNLEAGVPGYYPTFGAPTPTIHTGYDGSAWTPSTGTGEAIASGQGFLWYFFDNVFTPVEPTSNASSAVAFPVALSPVGPLNTADVDVVMHTDGNRINAMGNPFGTPLDVTDVVNWPGGNRVASKGRVFVWDPDLSTWRFGATAPVVEPWQGFAVRAKQSGGTLTIPASAALTDGGSVATAKQADAYAERRAIAFELEGRDAATGRLLMDAALEVAFEDDATAGWDEADAEKFAPLANAYVVLGALGTDARGETVLKAAESRATEAVSFSVPLALESVGADADLTLRWPALANLPAHWEVTLEDAATGETVDLRSASSYAFRASSRSAKALSPREVPALTDADADAAQTRFVLHVKTDATESEGPTAAFGLGTVRPNPVRGEARIAFSLADDGVAVVTVLDVRGREVARLADGPWTSGRHEVTWATAGVAPGVYVVRLASGGEVQTRRAVVVR
ncbi:MAG: M36 family metallopeptidase, partial [Bacteroidota bacterium]